MPILANIIEEAFSPLIKLFESIMVFIHAHLVGGSWGLAIVGLTVLTRAVLVPLTFKQLKSMQEMQRMAPQMNALKEKYKDDKQRQQQEIMKFYKENKINPLASCLPFLLQLPVFISLFYMLRTDLKKRICGPSSSLTTTRCTTPRSRASPGMPSKYIEATGCQERCALPGSAKFLFIPDITAKATGDGADRPDRPLHRVADLLHADGDGLGRPEPAAHDAAAPARDRRVPVPLPGRPAGVLDHDEPVDDRPAVLHSATHRTRACGDAGKGVRGRRGRLAQRQARPLRGGGKKGEPALAGVGVAGGIAAAPPPPPRRKKKRSGRRR